MEQKIECCYENYSWIHQKNIYTCKIKSQIIDSKSIVLLNGNHKDGKSNVDVLAVDFLDCVILSVPQGLMKIFPNLKTLQIDNSKLNYITRDCLKEYVNLETLWLYRNNISFLPADLLDGLVNFKYFLLNDTKTEIIEPGIFDKFTQLKFVELVYNKRVKTYSTIDGIKQTATMEEIKNEIQEKYEAWCASFQSRIKEIIQSDALNVTKTALEIFHAKDETNKKTNDELKAQIENLRAKNEDLKTENENFKKNFDDLRTGNEMMKAKNLDLVTENEHFKIKLNELEKENEIYKINLDKLNSNVENLKAEKKEVESKNEIHKLKFEEFKAIMENENLKDFIIKTKCEEFKAHKFVLAARCPAFKTVIEGNIHAECLNLVDVSTDIFKEIFSFIYTDKLPESDDIDFIELLKASDRLKIDKLKDFAAVKLMDVIDSVNALEILTISNKCDYEELKKKAFDEIKKFFDNEPISDDLMNEPEKLRELIEIKKEKNQFLKKLEEKFNAVLTKK